MFSNCLKRSEVLVLAPELESEFSNIAGDGTFKGDDFALAMARLFLKPRVPADVRITVRVVDSNCADWITWVKDKERFSEVTSQDNTITFCVCDKVKTVETLVSNMKCMSSWKEKTARELDLMKERLGIILRIFSSEERKSTVVFTNVDNYSSWHYLVCLFNVFCPWYIKDRTEAESKFIKILSKEDSGMSVICKAMNDMVAAAVDVASAKKRYYLYGYEGKLRNVQRERYAKQMESARSQINKLMSDLRDQYREYEDWSLLVAAIDNSNVEIKNELMDYFLSNKNVSVESGDKDGNIVYVVTGYMTLFDPEIAREYINNWSSVFYTRSSYAGLTESDTKKLMTGIFIDSNIKVRMCSAWRLSFGGGVLPIEAYGYGCEYDSYLPNTHLDKYGCMGGWQQALEKSCDKCDYVYAVDTTCAESGNLNLSDTVVLGSFLEELLREGTVVLELPDGRVVNYIDAIKWIEEDKSNE